MLETKCYLENDLGLDYQPTSSRFKLWSPRAQAVSVNIYETADKQDDNLRSTVKMMQKNHIWTAEIPGDLAGLFYTYLVIHEDGLVVETNDIYAKAVGLNGDRGAIIDLQQTNPVGWLEDQRVSTKTITDAFIWEVHVADFSSDEESGVSVENRGKYLAFTEKNTTLNSQGTVATGVKYLKELGVNYVHLLPAYDTDNDELASDYNWGYNPKNYNVPEGRYASNPADPSSRIREFKQMVQSLHQAKIGVVLDVVYNHTALTEQSWFNLTVPNYYYRQTASGGFADGSACGNEVASERVMVREFIANSVLYWAQEYHLDGFRFDLMGLHDVTTMNLVRQRLDDNGLEQVILYGEPWDAGSHEIQLPNEPANKAHADRLVDGIAVFNDDFRDAVKGYVFEELTGAFVQGQNGQKQTAQGSYKTAQDLQASLVANTRVDLAKETQYAQKAWSRTPAQTISYVSAHDNLTLWDKLVLSNKSVSGSESYQKDPEIMQQNQLAATLLFMSQGGIFMQAGEEFGRTKYGDENSYVSPLTINQLKWSQVHEFKELTAFYRGLWQIRQAYPPLRDSSCQTANSVTFAKCANPNVIAFTIPNLLGTGQWQQLAVIVNGSSEATAIELLSSIALPEKWTCLVNTQGVSLDSQAQVETASLVIAPKSCLVLGA